MFAHGLFLLLTTLTSPRRKRKIWRRGLKTNVVNLPMYRNPVKNLTMVAITTFLSFGLAATQSGGASTGMLYDFWLNSDDGLVAENGLETNDYRNVQILIEDLDRDATTIGLSKQAIRTRVDLRLLESDLRPANARDNERPYLYVRVSVVGGANSIGVMYIRRTYFDSPPYFYGVTAITWDRSNTGTHDGSSASVLESLDDLLDVFLQDYLTANLKQN